MGSGDGLTIAQLFCYPVKSCGGIQLPELAVITPTGLVFDRRWVVVKAGTGRFVTQRQEPKMCRIATELVPAAVLRGEDPAAHPGAALVLQAPGMPKLRVPLNPGGPRPLCAASVWEWKGLAEDEGAAAAEWLTEYLGQPVRLLRYAGTPGAGQPPAEDPKRRHANREFSPDGHEVAFADGFPLLVALEASLADLNGRMDTAIQMDRFRPNVILAGGTAWEEDSWDQVRLAPAGGEDGPGVTLLAVKPCSRCKIPTIDQETSVVGDEPTRTLSMLRSGQALGWTDPPSFKLAVFFGTNMCITSVGGGVLRVGGGAEVASRRQGPPPQQQQRDVARNNRAIARHFTGCALAVILVVISTFIVRFTG